MYPLLGASVLTLICAIDRGWFWCQLLRQEDQIVWQVLEAAREDWQKAGAIAQQAGHTPIGRFLEAPFKLKRPTLESIRLALESAGDKEFAQMRKGNKLLETVIAISPLLGLLGTVTGLILTFSNLKIGGAMSSGSTTKAAGGVGEALISTATGMIVAIIALVFFRVFVTLQIKQAEYFSEVGDELALLFHDCHRSDE